MARGERHEAVEPAVEVGFVILQCRIRQAVAAPPDDKDRLAEKIAKVREKREKKVDQADRDAATARALQDGALNPLMTVEAQAAVPAAPGEAPRYFSHPNYANSPLPVLGTTGAHAAHAAVQQASLVTAAPGLAAPMIHTAGYLLATGLIAWLVFARLGLRKLTKWWINVDAIWAAALVGTGVIALF